MILKTKLPKALFLGLTFTSTTLFAQNIYIKPTIGFTLPVINKEFVKVDEALDPVIQESNLTNGDNSTKSAKGNAGEGIRLGLAAGKMFNDNFGLELGIDYLNGKNQTFSKTTIITESLPTIYEITAHIWSIAISPSIIIQGKGEKLVPYARLGLYIPLGGYMYIDANVDDPSGLSTGGLPLSQQSTTKVTSSFTLGYQGALGVKYILSDKISAFGELHVLQFNSLGKSAEVTSYEQKIMFPDGTVMHEKTLSDLTTYEKKKIFKEELTHESNILGHPDYDENKPKEEISSFLDLSSVNLNFGIYIIL